MSVTIRHIEKGDYKQIHAMFTEPAIYEGTLQLPYPSLQKWQQRLDEQSPNQHTLVAILDDSIVGMLGLQTEQNPRRRHVATFGITVSTKFQGRGIGSKLLAAATELADNWLNTKRIELTVYTDNSAAIALYKKHGFEIEGTSCAFAFRNGSYVDAFHMARVRN
ncbi:GNAT family N-acetyltransferase [Dongshaea marina]|uniref:GNAT family N-acetyltransferase n=1 Tax=Dongshaea marina TaxID=2047966 RepID=UPI000D3E44B1|nr:GNAT family N-acetyltransferase [Dongshaea marina]